MSGINVWEMWHLGACHDDVSSGGDLGTCFGGGRWWGGEGRGTWAIAGLKVGCALWQRKVTFRTNFLHALRGYAVPLFVVRCESSIVAGTDPPCTGWFVGGQEGRPPCLLQRMYLWEGEGGGFAQPFLFKIGVGTEIVLER